MTKIDIISGFLGAGKMCIRDRLWGNPLFRWDVMKKDSYSWWTKRISAMRCV